MILVACRSERNLARGVRSAKLAADDHLDRKLVADHMPIT